MNRYVYKLVGWSAALLMLLGASTVAAQEPISMGIVTGGPRGTYYQFGLNLRTLLERDNIQLRVDNTNGSVENIYAVYQRPNTQLGIVQSDVLAFITKVQDDPVLKRIAEKTKMVFPLYNEEIHLVGKNDIQNFDYLAGKRVAVGEEGSGTYLTVRLLFLVSGVEPAAMVPIGTDEALARLKSGEIDAMFYVAGYPVKLFSENVSASDNLAVIPIMNKSILEFYPDGEIPAGTYPWQETAVRTAAVKAVLVSYDFRRYHCENVGLVAQRIYENLNWLRENGHAKWQSVDLDYELKGWEQYDCVKNHLARVQPSPRAVPQSMNPVLNAIKDMLGE